MGLSVGVDYGGYALGELLGTVDGWSRGEVLGTVDGWPRGEDLSIADRWALEKNLGTTDGLGHLSDGPLNQIFTIL